MRTTSTRSWSPTTTMTGTWTSPRPGARTCAAAVETARSRAGRQSSASFTQAGAVADFNGDGWPDLAFSEACDEIEIDCD